MTTDIFELVVSRAAVESGRSLDQLVTRSSVHLNGVTAEVQIASRKTAPWQPWEDEYLRANLGFQTEQQISEFLGRSIMGVHLRWKRDLHLPAPSKDPRILTAHQAATMLGIDGHKFNHWCDMGMLKSRRMRGSKTQKERVIRLLDKTSFLMWVVNPENWIYFDWRQIQDAHLKRLCALRAARWGDEWWTTVQVAQHHQVTSKDVLRLITVNKRLPGKQAATSLDGRHKDPVWLNWFVKRSDALRAEFPRGRGAGQEKRFTPRADAWMLAAYRAGWSYSAINRSMGSKVTDWTLSKRILKLDLEQQTGIKRTAAVES